MAGSVGSYAILVLSTKSSGGMYTSAASTAVPPGGATRVFLGRAGICKLSQVVTHWAHVTCSTHMHILALPQPYSPDPE